MRNIYGVVEGEALSQTPCTPGQRRQVLFFHIQGPFETQEFHKKFIEISRDSVSQKKKQERGEKIPYSKRAFILYFFPCKSVSPG